MDKPLIDPKIVYVVMALMVMLAVVTSLAYWFESGSYGLFLELDGIDTTHVSVSALALVKTFNVVEHISAGRCQSGLPV